jgi:hypothetical protein
VNVYCRERGGDEDAEDGLEFHPGVGGLVLRRNERDLGGIIWIFGR